MEPAAAAAAAAEVTEPTTAAMDQVESPTALHHEETAAAATAAAAPPTPSAPHAQRSMRASTRHNSLATAAIQEQNKKLHEIIRQEKKTVVRKPKSKPACQVEAAVAVSSSPDEHDSSDSAWSPPESKMRRPKVKPEPSKEKDEPPIAPAPLSAFPPPILPQPVVNAEFASDSASLPPLPLLPPLPPSMIAQLQEAFNITARQQGLLPPFQPMSVDQMTTAAPVAVDLGGHEGYGPIKRKSAAAKKRASGSKKKQATKTKRKIQSSTPANKRSRLKKPTAQVAAAAAASSTLPPIPLELLQPPLQQPFLTPAQLLHASTALSLLASSNQFDPPNSSSMHPWQMPAPLRSVSPLPSHELQPMPFPPLPTAQDAAAYLASSPPPDDFGTEEETSLRCTSALSHTPLSTAATPLSVPSELADAESMSPRSVANAMLLSSPSLIPYSFGAEPDGSSPSPLRLAAQAIEAPVVSSPFPTLSMLSAPSFIPPIDPSKIRFGPLDSEVYRQRVKHNAAIAQRAAADFEDEQ